jgi:predicted AlkP superfamily pyrophosphatase or phosphodiesterase
VRKIFSVVTVGFFWAVSVFAKVDHVVVVSIDGGKPASLLKSKMPILEKMIDEGAVTFKAETTLPSNTLPSHTSMLTGVGPEIHQITWNFNNPFAGAVKVPTAFGIAKANGKTTAAFAAKDKFKHLNVKGAWDHFSMAAKNASEAQGYASDYLKKNKPHFMFIHFPDADVVGHASGWESPQQIKALEDIDKSLGRLMDSLASAFTGKSYAVIITADHGGSGKSHGSDSDEDRIIPWIVWGSEVKAGHKISRFVSTKDTAATALWLLDIPVPNDWEGSPVVEAFQ